jgi:hypothetical protein
MSFINPAGSFDNEAHGGPVTVIAPADASTYQMPSGTRDLYINTAAVNTMTIRLPQVQAGEMVSIASKGSIGSITFQTRLGVATGLTPNITATAAVILRYINRTVGWVRWA